MMELEEILARARSPGAFVERRHFTLSRAHAIEKLRSFTLRRPGQAVLELVQAAVCARATYIAIRTEQDRLVVAWVGAPRITEEAFESLFDYLFVDALASQHRHLVQLAIAVNGMLRDERCTVRIESGSGAPDDTVRLDLTPNGAGTVGRSDIALAGTYVVMERIRPWWRFWPRTGITEEQVLVEEQCSHTPVPILLNGVAPFGYRANRAIRTFHSGGEQPFDHGSDSRRGSLFLSPTESRVELVVSGVRITTVALDELGSVLVPRPAGEVRHWFSGVVCDDSLRKTADQADIVRDERFTAMLHALRAPCEALAHRENPDWAFPINVAPMTASPMTASPTSARSSDLPQQLEQLAPRSRLSLDDLLAMDPNVPLFRTAPAGSDVLLAMQHAADPIRLPFPVLLLTDPQAAAVEAALGRPVGNLTDASGIELTVRAAAGRGGFQTVGPMTSDHRERQWQARFRADAPPSGLVPSDHTMLLETEQGRTRRIHAVPLCLPGVCITVAGLLPEQPNGEALRSLVLRHTGRALYTHESLPMPTRAALIAAVVQVLPLSPDRLRLSLPTDWPSDPLDVSLEDWAKHLSQGTRMVVSEAVALAYRPVESVVGIGHIGATPFGAVVAGVVWRDSQWHPDASPSLHGAEPALLAWDGPPPTELRRLTPEGFMTVRGTVPPERLLEGARCLRQALANQPPSAPRERALHQRWLATLAQAFNQPEWWSAPRRSAGRLRAGIGADRQPGHQPTYAEARTNHQLEHHVLPPWVTSGTVPGGWWAHRTFPEGWLGIPQTRTPSEVRPQVLIDTGLEWTWFDAPDTLPCVGILRLERPSRQSIWPFLCALWTRIPATIPVPGPSTWVTRACRISAPQSLLYARLKSLEAPTPSAAQPTPPLAPNDEANRVFRELQAAARQTDDVDALLERQRAILHAALAGPPPSPTDSAL